MPWMPGAVFMPNHMKRLLRNSRTVLNYISGRLHWTAVIAGVTMVTLVILSSFMRYLVGSPFEFTEEVVGLFFLVTAFAALPKLTLYDRHIDVSIIYTRLSRNGRLALKLFSYIVFFIFCAWFTAITWEFARFSAEVTSRTETSGLLLYPWMMVMPLICAITSAICLFKVILIIRVFISKPAPGNGTRE